MGAMTMKTSNRWLGLLSVAVTMSSGAAYMSYDTLGSSGSFYSSGGCVTVYQGDGYCDHMNNNAECGFDGGDCCSCTCTATDYYNCGMNGFACVDPGAACVNDDDVTIEVVENCYHPGSIGDGYCDSANNKAVCGYDGGDCCSCTCVVPENSSSYISSYSSAYMSNFLCSASGSGFACIDPAAPCVDDDDITVEMAENCQYIQGVGDGYCDQGNNNEKCGYDGGDCCSCTCTAPENSSQGYGSYGYTCSENAFGSGFACIDPSAECVDDDDITADMVENCGYIQGIGNGYCDHINNNELCGYDGGDCCSCTCTAPETSPDVATSYYGAYYYINYQACGNGFACIDPSATCVNDDDITVDIVENCDPVSVGDAYCDQGNNTPQCNYDGGDCCSCTCEDTPNQQCGEWSGFACIDPSAECVNDDDITVNMFEHCWGGIGDGYCNPDNNKPECNYDGGDCCECTCEVDMSTTYSDGPWSGCTEFACVDPAAPCVDDDSITVGMLDKCPWATGIGNGYCQPELNNADCLYDGGDCCSCTCETAWDDDWGCSAVDCKDPSAPCIGEDSNMSYGFGSWDDDTMSHGSYEFADFDDDVAAFAADAGEENAGLRNELPAKGLVLGVALGFLFPLWAFSGC